MPLHVADSFRGASGRCSVSARITVKDLGQAPGLSVALNGHELILTRTPGDELEADVSPEWLRCGYNVFEFERRAAGRMTVQELKLAVEYETPTASAGAATHTSTP